MTATTDFASIAKLAAAQLPLAAHQVALRLAAAHGHLWATAAKNTIWDFGPEIQDLEGALLAVQAECERLNSPESGSGPLGLELRHALRTFQAGEEIVPCYTHTTASGRLAWNIVPDAESGWFMTLSVNRPAVTVAGRAHPEGPCIEARYDSTAGWSVIWGMGAPFYQRHLQTLVDAIVATALPGADEAVRKAYSAVGLAYQNARNAASAAGVDREVVKTLWALAEEVEGRYSKAARALEDIYRLLAPQQPDDPNWEVAEP